MVETRLPKAVVSERRARRFFSGSCLAVNFFDVEPVSSESEVHSHDLK